MKWNVIYEKLTVPGDYVFAAGDISVLTVSLFHCAGMRAHVPAHIHSI